MLILVMGVTGAGKTTIGRLLAARFGFAFYDADDFHPAANRAKMAANVPLDDADRGPWLAAIGAAAAEWERKGEDAVLACSALKKAYRAPLFAGLRGEHRIVYLALAREDAARRIAARAGSHPIIGGAYDRVLEGQYRDLEPPERAIAVDAKLGPAEVIERVARALVREGVAPRAKTHFAERSDSPDGIGDRRVGELCDSLLARIGPLRRALIVPPDFTRAHSGAGPIAVALYQRLSRRAEVDVLPALGTHRPMSASEIAAMFPGIPAERFFVHDFRRDLSRLGEVPASFVREASGGRVNSPIPCEVDARLVTGRYDRVFSIGQLVPHEVAGIAGQSKNVFIGLGGKETIDATHFLGAASGMESIMGRVANPVRDVLSYMAAELARPLPPITYLLTVRAKNEAGGVATRGLFAGDDDGCYYAGAPLARDLNVEVLDRPIAKAVVYLDPAEFHSTWLGNKAIYRTRMAIADGGELLVLAPGVDRFGEDRDIDRLIRRHGYQGTERTLAAVAADGELRGSLAAAAHLIHGSSEGRFRIRYATRLLDSEAIESVGYEHVDFGRAADRYDPACLTDGENVLPDGEKVFFVSNPALGLWSVAEKIRG